MMIPSPLAAIGRPAGGAELPDFTTALVAYGLWGMTPDFQEGDSGDSLMEAGGSGSGPLAQYGLPTPPHYLDLDAILALEEAVTVSAISNQSGAGNTLAPPDSQPDLTINQTVRVSGAGSLDANQTCVSAGVLNGKLYYVPDSVTDPLEAGIFWDTDHWDIRAGVTGDTRRYRSFDDVVTPDLCTTWVVAGPGSLPVPTVASSNPTYAEVAFNG